MKKIVLIGGGHGLSNIVKGFKGEDVDLSIVVSSTDDGGHTGLIRDEFDVVAVGDLRMVLSSLFDKESFMKELFDYRFDSIHGVKGVSLGNLIIAAMLFKYKDIDKVIEHVKCKENVVSNVFVSVNNSLKLCAKNEKNEVIKGECLIGDSNSVIKSLFVEDEAFCNEIMINKIMEADAIVLCPGSLYTSVCAVLCIDKIKEAILKSKGVIIYVCNIMTQNGETVGYSVNDHEKAIKDIIGREIDKVIVNSGMISDDVLFKYEKENSGVVACEKLEDNYVFYDLVEIREGKVNHNSELTKKIILSIIDKMKI